MTLTMMDVKVIHLLSMLIESVCEFGLVIV